MNHSGLRPVSVSYIHMINLIRQGNYSLIETKGQTKILLLDENTYAWVYARNIGELLVSSHKKHKVDHLLAVGKYRLYEVKKEPKLTDLAHLELHAGDGMWQGYLLPTGLPNGEKHRNRIIPTKEVITKSTI